MKVPYPDCKIHTCEQRSPEWFDARRGLLTASQFGDWLTKAGKVAEKARLTAASKCLAEMAGYPDPPPWENDDMKRGVQLEPTARDLFMEQTGIAVEEVGFCKSVHGWFGCSPDGLIPGATSGLEIKIPRASKLIQYHEIGELPDEYKHQVHGSMAVTGATSWHFFAWHPDFPAFHILVKRDSYTSEMLEGLKSYSRYFADLAERMDSK
jgi:putative phage-type endonuclease